MHEGQPRPAEDQQATQHHHEHEGQVEQDHDVGEESIDHRVAGVGCRTRITHGGDGPSPLVVAIVGKLLSGIGAFGSKGKWIVGVGMVPRGEVGLVFATIGRTLGVIDDAVFAAIALMVIVTTVIAPPWLKFLVGRQAVRESGGA